MTIVQLLKVRFDKLPKEDSNGALTQNPPLYCKILFSSNVLKLISLRELIVPDVTIGCNFKFPFNV